jgi:alkylhydroperoxidase family enzyme
MARVPYIDAEDLPADQRHLPLSVSNITRAMSNSPGVAHQSGQVARFVAAMDLDPRLRELAIMQVGYAMGCAYEYAHHVKVALAVGVSDADILAIAEESAGRRSGLEPLARTVLSGAREMTDGQAMSEATFAELQAALGERHLVELVFAIANYTGVVRILQSLDVGLEDEYLGYLERFPLPGP